MSLGDELIDLFESVTLAEPLTLAQSPSEPIPLSSCSEPRHLGVEGSSFELFSFELLSFELWPFDVLPNGRGPLSFVTERDGLSPFENVLNF